jgi:hypothetical protein
MEENEREAEIARREKELDKREKALLAAELSKKYALPEELVSPLVLGGKEPEELLSSLSGYLESEIRKAKASRFAPPHSGASGTETRALSDAKRRNQREGRA